MQRHPVSKGPVPIAVIRLDCAAYEQGLREGGSGGTSYPGLGGPGRVQVAASSFVIYACTHFLILGQKWDQVRVKTFFFCSSPNFGPEMGPNLSEGLFFCSSPNFRGPASIFVPPGKISLRGPAYELYGLSTY